MTDEPTAGRQLTQLNGWDYFLSYDHSDAEIAVKLKDALPSSEKVFRDKDDIPDGAVWSAELSKALKSSLVYVFLVSQNRDDTHLSYLRIELDFAFSLWRKNQETRRIVPVYLNLDDVPDPDETLAPLGSLQGFVVPNPNDLSEASSRLRKTLEYVKPREAKRLMHVATGGQAASKFSEGRPLAGIIGATRASLVEPFFFTLLGLFALVTLAMIACVVLLSFGFTLLPALALLSLLWIMLVTLILWLIVFSSHNTNQLARGNVKGG